MAQEDVPKQDSQTPRTNGKGKEVASSQPTESLAATASSSASNGNPSSEASSTMPAIAPEKATSKTPAKTTGESKEDGKPALTGKELKLQKQAEKQAKRAQAKAEKGVGGGGPPPAASTPASSSRAEAGRPLRDGVGNPRQGQQSQGQQQQQQQRGGQDGRAHHRRTGSQSQNSQPLPLRRRPSPSGATAKVPRKLSKEVGLFGHLYNQPRRQTLEGVSKEVHPAVLALGFQMSNYVICGSNARCVAMLLAFKKAIQSYTTPLNTSLARHLTSHYLSPQIDYLKSHRPISVSMGNAIRWLKDYIIHIDPDTPENEAKSSICAAIDIFIRERITVADTAIAETASSKIRNGSTVITYAKSSIVEQTLLRAHEHGTRFKVIVLDSRPLFEGKNLARSLANAGIETQYMLLSAAGHAVRGADLVLLGAHAMMANGRLFSRVGTASVAMLAHSRDVPVIVCCESVKFTDRVALDSIVLNEIAPPDELLLPTSQTASGVPTVLVEAEKSGKKGKGEAEEKDGGGDVGLARWKDVPGLQLLNILYDVTPAEFVDMVITEYGSLPPTSVPVVHRISTERDVRA